MMIGNYNGPTFDELEQQRIERLRHNRLKKHKATCLKNRQKRKRKRKSK